MSSVLKISEAASLALHAMIALAKNQDRPVTVKEVSEDLNISANHLSKVMQRLVKAGLVLSIKGSRGGFKLVDSAENITFLDIYEAIEGKFSPTDCLLSAKPCSGSTCIMGGLISSVNKQVKDYFSRTKLSQFIE